MTGSDVKLPYGFEIQPLERVDLDSIFVSNKIGGSNQPAGYYSLVEHKAVFRGSGLIALLVLHPDNRIDGRDRLDANHAFV